MRFAVPFPVHQSIRSSFETILCQSCLVIYLDSDDTGTFLIDRVMEVICFFNHSKCNEEGMKDWIADKQVGTRKMEKLSNGDGEIPYVQRLTNPHSIENFTRRLLCLTANFRAMRPKAPVRPGNRVALQLMERFKTSSGRKTTPFTERSLARAA